MKIGRKRPESPEPRYAGVRAAVDGSEAALASEIAASDFAAAYPVSPASRMADGWAAAAGSRERNAFGRPVGWVQPESAGSAAATTAGLSMSGLRATSFSSGPGVADMYDGLCAAAGKRLSFVLQLACRSLTRHAMNVHAGHDDYHALGDAGLFQLFAGDVQEAADFALIAHRIAELSLTPGVCAQDGFHTSHSIESVLLPEEELVREYLGDPADIIESPTPAQRLAFGERRRRIPELFDLDYPAALGVVQNQESYAQGLAAARTFYLEHVAPLADRAMAELAELTGRRYARASGYRLEDADYAFLAQGSVVADAQAVADHLRAQRKLKVGVLNLSMFRPFPADLLTRALKGKKAVTVLERVEDALAGEPPLLREARAAVSRALENGRDREARPYPELEGYADGDAPRFFSARYGLGGLEVRPGDLIAAAENMAKGAAGLRRYYLGLDFVRPGTKLPKLQIWQERLLESYPDLSNLSLPPAVGVPPLPDGALSVRINSLSGHGAMAMGRMLTRAAAALLGCHVKAGLEHGAEKKGRPTTFRFALAPEPVRLNYALEPVQIVLATDPYAFRIRDPLEGLGDGGVLVMEGRGEGGSAWAALPAPARREIRERGIRLFAVEAQRIAREEASRPDLTGRLRAAVFLGAFLRISPLMEREGLDETELFEAVRDQVAAAFGARGGEVVEDNLRAVRRGFAELDEIEIATAPESESEVEATATPTLPASLATVEARDGLGHPGHFWEQVGYLHASGIAGLADPFAALGTMPAATASFHDWTDRRAEVPRFVAEKCTGCGGCWTQCPDSALPARVNEIDQVIEATIRTVSNGRSFDRLQQITKHLARESRRLMKGQPVASFADVLASAYENVMEKLGWDADRRAEADQQFEPIRAALDGFPLAKTEPFYDRFESKEKGTGGLLSITVNPDACKGCNLCVEVCEDGALIAVEQDARVVEGLRDNWALWMNLPDTPDRYVDPGELENGLDRDRLPALLLKESVYGGMTGGDAACPGCGEKTAVHLVLAAVNARMGPRVAKFVARLDDLIERLDARAREDLAADADLDALVEGRQEVVDISMGPDKQAALARLARSLRELKHLRWRYAVGPGGRGRSMAGFTNATGCSSIWGSTYPYNPYPFPWVGGLLHDAPATALGVFEAQMRKMAETFASVRRAELELAGDYDPQKHEAFFESFDWRSFDDEEFGLCPPIFAVGGDGAMSDAGLASLSGLLASGVPIRVLVLDTQGLSSLSGQPSGSAFSAQAPGTAPGRAGDGGKREPRKELALLAMAHRDAYVLQSSQSSAPHLLAGVLRGLEVRRPSVFILYAPCQPEHGLADNGAARAARMALESRAFPLLAYDPEAGPTLSERLDLEGNPESDALWPSRRLEHVDEAGDTASITRPFTVVDWAATEGRFQAHFTPAPPDAPDLIPLHEYLDLAADERKGAQPFIWSLDAERHLTRKVASPRIVELAEERVAFWSHLRQMAGLEISDSLRSGIEQRLEAEFEKRVDALRSEFESRLARLKARYPHLIARRLAEGLIRSGNGSQTVADLLARAEKMPGAMPLSPDIPLTGGAAALEAGAAGTDASGAGEPGETAGPSAAEPAAADEEQAGDEAATATAVEAEEEEDEGDLVIEPYIETVRCTTCNECTNLNGQMFAYNDNKQAYIKDSHAGTFRELVLAAEKCPVDIIHPGTPLNPDEPDLDKWIKRAEPYN